MGAGLEALLPLAKAFEVGGGAVAEPAVELGLVFELLAAGAGVSCEALTPLYLRPSEAELKSQRG